MIGILSTLVDLLAEQCQSRGIEGQLSNTFPLADHPLLEVPLIPSNEDIEEQDLSMAYPYGPLPLPLLLLVFHQISIPVSYTHLTLPTNREV